MTKQEKIEGRIATILIGVAQGTHNGFEATRQILEYLHSQGLAIKVDRELPLVEFTLTGHMTPSEVSKIGEAYRKGYSGCVAVESLIDD